MSNIFSFYLKMLKNSLITEATVKLQYYETMSVFKSINEILIIMF